MMKPYESTREQDEAVSALTLVQGSVHVEPGAGTTLLATVTEDQTERRHKYRILEDGTLIHVPRGVMS